MPGKTLLLRKGLVGLERENGTKEDEVIESAQSREEEKKLHSLMMPSPAFAVGIQSWTRQVSDGPATKWRDPAGQSETAPRIPRGRAKKLKPVDKAETRGDNRGTRPYSVPTYILLYKLSIRIVRDPAPAADCCGRCGGEHVDPRPQNLHKPSMARRQTLLLLSGIRSYGGCKAAGAGRLTPPGLQVLGRGSSDTSLVA